MSPMDIEAGRILIFKNDKAGNEKRPDYRGECKTPDGQHLRFSLWLEESKTGVKYMQGQIEALETSAATTTSGATTATEAREAVTQDQTQTDDDIPF